MHAGNIRYGDATFDAVVEVIGGSEFRDIVTWKNGNDGLTLSVATSTRTITI
jgi:hypothetical protein